ncbi:DUF5327 family protein [Salicibibacter kimchii]|uniref:Uncharacterized protein n=1 Tax=Salicibibacter kimchii TaxID=2099786 RepID=A0A345BZS7_9BACI|nr:DUF5327 family protein [Salicibibacter kimchii]AXF56458.1 hypothetical protein DT065_10775 [Salicibibacter kimchii]
MHVAAETIVAKIKQETANLEHALKKTDSKEEIREHARLIRAFSELIEEGSGAISSKKEQPAPVKGEGMQTKAPAAVPRSREGHEVSAQAQGNLLEF